MSELVIKMFFHFAFYKKSTENHLNLPTKITFANNFNIVYLYNAVGQKLQKVVQSGEITKTEYLTGFQYFDQKLKHFPHAEGYVNVVGSRYKYVFNYTDHLGNVRLGYTDADNNNRIAENEIIEENHYYPFGLKHSAYNTQHLAYVPNDELNHSILYQMPRFAGDGEYNYMYNGKEYQDELGLNMYDYGARFYDPAAPRFWQIDPKAEKYYNISPTVYVADNPVNAIDPTGEEIIFIVRGETRKQDQSFTYRKGNFYHADGKRYNPGKEGVSKTMYNVLTAYRQIEKGDDKTLKSQLSTLEKSEKKHYVEEGTSSEVGVYDPDHGFVSETKEAIKNGESMGTQTTFNFSESEKKDFEVQEGVPVSNLSIVVHEMQHQFDYDQGNQADSQGKSGATSPTEQRAVKNENRARKAERLPKRTTYGGVPIDPKKL